MRYSRTLFANIFWEARNLLPPHSPHNIDHWTRHECQCKSFKGRYTGEGGSNRAVSQSGLVLPSSCFEYVCPFCDFLDFSGTFLISSGICPIRPFPLSRPARITCKEHSRTGPRHNPDLSQKSGKPPVWKAQVYLLSSLVVVFRRLLSYEQKKVFCINVCALTLPPSQVFIHKQGPN